MANNPGDKDDGRTGDRVPGSGADGVRMPPKMHPVYSAIVEPSGRLKVNDSLAFKSDAPRDAAMPSSTSGFSSAEALKINAQSFAFKSDAPRETRDAAMLSSVDRRIPPEALRILAPTELSAFHAEAPRDTAMPSSSSSFGGAGGWREASRVAPRRKAGVLGRVWGFFRGMFSR